jgi:hypothetical protein
LASFLGHTSDGFNTETAAALLVSCNVLVVVMSIVAYWISVRHSGSSSGDVGEMAGSIQEMGNLAGWDSEVGELTTPYRKLPGVVSKNCELHKHRSTLLGLRLSLPTLK